MRLPSDHNPLRGLPCSSLRSMALIWVFSAVLVFHIAERHTAVTMGQRGGIPPYHGTAHSRTVQRSSRVCHTVVQDMILRDGLPWEGVPQNDVFHTPPPSRSIYHPVVRRYAPPSPSTVEWCTLGQHVVLLQGSRIDLDPKQ